MRGLFNGVQQGEALGGKLWALLLMHGRVQAAKGTRQPAEPPRTARKLCQHGFAIYSGVKDAAAVAKLDHRTNCRRTDAGRGHDAGDASLALDFFRRKPRRE